MYLGNNFKKELKEKIDELSTSYNISKRRIIKYYKELSEYECFDEIFGFDCLELVCQQLVTLEFERDRKIKDNEKIETDYQSTLDYIYNNSIYRIYGDDSIPFLNDKYKDIFTSGNSRVLKYINNGL